MCGLLRFDEPAPCVELVSWFRHRAFPITTATPVSNSLEDSIHADGDRRRGTLFAPKPEGFVDRGGN